MSVLTGRERNEARGILEELREQRGSTARAAVTAHVSEYALWRVRRGDLSAETLDQLRLVSASMRRCVECNDPLHESWPYGRCAPCVRAVVERVEARERDGDFAAWLRRPARSGGAR